MTFFFGPNIIGTQTNSPKPKIVEWSSFSGTALTSLVPTPSLSQADVVEGQWAWAAFKFVDPTNVNVSWELKDAASLGLNLTGASSDDYVNGGQLYAYALDAAGNVISTGVTYTQPAGTTTKTSGTISFADNTLDPVNVGTGVWGILLATKIKEDTVVETGDRALFQVTNSDPTKFTDSAYVEKYVSIIDKFPAANLPEVIVSNHSGWAQYIDPLQWSTNLYTAGNIPDSTKLVNPTPTDSVLEGQWAYATFNVVTAGSGNPSATQPVQFDTNIRASFSGGSPSDYVTNSFAVRAWNGSDYAPSKNADGTYKLLAGTTHIVMAVKTAKDALVETGEEVLFQFGKTDVNSFVGSDYLEKKVAIVDSVNKWDLGRAAVAFAQQDNVQDSFTIDHGDTFVSNGLSSHTPGSTAYKTITGLATGDFLNVDILNVSNPGLHLANWGILSGVADEGVLVQGLRMLNGVQCAQGGVYVMQVQNDTYVLIDSDYSGTLVMNSSTNADIFVKLAGVPASSIQSTDFVLS